MSGAGLHPRLSVHLASMMGRSLDDILAFLEADGIGAVTMTRPPLGERPEEAAARIRESGLRCIAYATANGSLIDSPDATLAQLAPIIDRAHALGAPTAITMTGPTPSRMPTGEACDRLVACLAPAMAHASARGVRLAFEHSSPTLRQIGFVTSLGDMIGVARETGISIAVETQNCWYERDLKRMFRDHVDHFAVVQCSDFAVGEELRMNRRVPGDGDMPLEWMIGELLDAGYTGFFDLEIVGPAIDREGHESAIRRGLDWLSECLARWGA